MRFATGAFFAAAAALVAAKEAPLNDNGNTVDDSYIVKFKDTVSPEDVQQHMDNLKEWNDAFPLRGEAGNGGIRVDKGEDSGPKANGKGDSSQVSIKNDGGNKNQEQGTKDDGSEKQHDEHSDSSQQQFDPWQASLEDWQKHYEQVISGISHAWFYQAINYFGYSGRFSREVLEKIRNDDRVAYVDKDQVVDI